MSFKPSQECIILAQNNCSSQLNNSSTKNTYSFAKTERFAVSLEKSQLMLAQPSLELPKGYAIGNSNRFNFTSNPELQLHPAPNQYTIQREFDKINGKKGYSLAVGRDKILACNLQNPIPGPGYYNGKKVSRNSPKYSMAQKNYAEGKSKMEKEWSPGPGNYITPPTIDAMGKYQLSNYQGSKAPIISSPIEKKVKIKQTCLPGPGSYNQTDLKREKGSLQYYEAKFQSFQGQSFTCSKRAKSLPKVQCKNLQNSHYSKEPGPGQYSMPSEFGVPLQHFPKYKIKSERKNEIFKNLYKPALKRIKDIAPKVSVNQNPINQLFFGKYLPPIIRDISA